MTGGTPIPKPDTYSAMRTLLALRERLIDIEKLSRKTFWNYQQLEGQ